MELIGSAGDTGYRAVPEVPDGEDDYGEKYADLPHCPAFKEIGDNRGPFDLGETPRVYPAMLRQADTSRF